MDLQDECAICKTETFSCAACDLPICNRPTCSTVVDPKHQNYSGDHLKKLANAKLIIMIIQNLFTHKGQISNDQSR